MVKALKGKQKHRVMKPSMTGSVTSKAIEADQGSQMNLKDSPVEQIDNALPGTSGETTVRQPGVPDYLDDMINDILGG